MVISTSIIVPNKILQLHWTTTCTVTQELLLVAYIVYCLGAVQYYTFKPVAEKKELLVFYGDEYFEEMGYEIDREDPENS